MRCCLNTHCKSTVVYVFVSVFVCMRACMCQELDMRQMFIYPSTIVRACARARSLSRFRSLFLSRSLSLSLSLSLCLSLSGSLSVSLSAPSLSLTHTHTHTHTLCLFPALFLALSPSVSLLLSFSLSRSALKDFEKGDVVLRERPYVAIKHLPWEDVDERLDHSSESSQVLIYCQVGDYLLFILIYCRQPLKMCSIRR